MRKEVHETMTFLQYRNNDVPRYCIGGSYRVSDPQGLTVHPEQLAHTVFRALPMNHNKYMGFRTTLNYRQERCSPENP